MIFWQLFITFCKIGIFTFGGGYAMLALIHIEVVVSHSWLTASEFADVVAVSQMTPGPIGINVATYSGYTAVVNAGYDAWLGILGAVLASFAVILLPVIAMLVVSHFLLKHKDSKRMSDLFYVLRLAIVGLLISAALLLANVETFGIPAFSLHFISSVAIFLAVFFVSFKYKFSPILLIILSGGLGLLLYF
ncbi:MAG: chromate transporter [Bacteroidales bacterium]|nr:chromate transporter [Bacteroidales bacterium]